MKLKKKIAMKITDIVQMSKEVIKCTKKKNWRKVYKKKTKHMYKKWKKVRQWNVWKSKKQRRRL